MTNERYAAATPAEKKTAEEEREEKMQALLKEGKVIHMNHPGRGICYVKNEKKAIEQKRRQGFEDVEYTEEVVKTARPVAKKKTARAKKE